MGHHWGAGSGKEGREGRGKVAVNMYMYNAHVPNKTK